MSKVILVDMLIGIMVGTACWLVGFVILCTDSPAEKSVRAYMTNQEWIDQQEADGRRRELIRSRIKQLSAEQLMMMSEIVKFTNGWKSIQPQDFEAIERLLDKIL